MKRREFFSTAGAAAGNWALASAWSRGAAAPYRITVSRSEAGATAQASGAAAPLHLQSMAGMESGAPLGGLGAGSVELRPDGYFDDWEITNLGAWAASGPLPSPERVNPPTPPRLEFFLWTRAEKAQPQLRRLYLRPRENDLYSLGYVQDVEAIEYEAWFPMISLRYRDRTLPVEASATAFSPFIPGQARASATPGFHLAFNLKNRSRQPVEATLLAVMDNPIVSTLADRKLRNQAGGARLFMISEAQPQDPADWGSLCLALEGGEASWISGTYRQYMLPGLCRWKSRRVNWMLLDCLQDFYQTGRLPNTAAERDFAQAFKLRGAQINALSAAEMASWLGRLQGDALFHRVIEEARQANPQMAASEEGMRTLLHEIAENLDGELAGPERTKSSWGTGALASTRRLGPGEAAETRFTFGWHFPHHRNAGGEHIGHRYSRWYRNAAEVAETLAENYRPQRASTEKFARTLAETSLPAPQAFAWSSHLGTLLKNCWWSEDGHYAIWEGLGCCGLSTTDVDYDGSSSILALFPELKMSQMRDIMRFQNAAGQVPHNYSNGFNGVDEGGYGRVDMNPQFVMMACRDYLWTGDRAYLEALWPGLTKAMEYTAALDTNGDGLPDKNCGFQTYDQWRMRGAPSYIASLWIGALRAMTRMARDLGHAEEVRRWQGWLDKASASYDRLLFNGRYFSLWVDDSPAALASGGVKRDEICMSDQMSGEWFSHLMGLETTTDPHKLAAAAESVWRNNFSPDTGLRNATAPQGGSGLLVMDNLQAGGVWSGIEYAFASFLMDHGRYAEGAQIVEAVHRRYLRAGMPWNHVECGTHYTRAMSSWTTLLAATGFKPDRPAQALTLAPAVPGDFHAPWVTAEGYGQLRRRGARLELACVAGQLEFKTLRVKATKAMPQAQLAGRRLEAHSRREHELTAMEFATLVAIRSGQTFAITT